MSIIKNLILVSFILLNISLVNAEEIKKVLKNKDWEAYVVNNENGKICFAQSVPILQAPKKDSREARLFVTFRPNEKISDEISITSRCNTYLIRNFFVGSKSYKKSCFPRIFFWSLQNWDRLSKTNFAVFIINNVCLPIFVFQNLFYFLCIHKAYVKQYKRY